MTDQHTHHAPADQDDQEPEIDWENQSYEVFNYDRTVGARANRAGEITGVVWTDAAHARGETYIIDQLMIVTGLAQDKSRVGMRREMEWRHPITSLETIQAMRLPTLEAYLELEAELLENNR